MVGPLRSPSTCMFPVMYMDVAIPDENVSVLPTPAWNTMLENVAPPIDLSVADDEMVRTDEDDIVREDVMPSEDPMADVKLMEDRDA
eukprot:40192-Eustigmatos_ZCMA.PRE.1